MHYAYGMLIRNGEEEGWWECVEKCVSLKCVIFLLQLSELEQRVIEAEERANNAEDKVKSPGPHNEMVVVPTIYVYS